MRKFLATLLALVMTLALMVPASWGENKETYQLPDSLAGKTVILHTNDVHGAIDKYAKVAALRDECYDKGAHQVILLDAGDYSQGSPYVSLSKGATALDLMALVGYDVITLGNHEFDYGFPQLMENLKKHQGDFMVACNNLVDDEGELIFAPGGTAPIYADDTYETELFRIAIVGMATPETQTKANPALMKGLSFIGGKDLYKVTQEDVDMARSEGNADIVIALGHLGVEKTYTANADVLVPNLSGLNLADATSALQKNSLTLRTVGDGGTVTGQIPAAGASIPGGSQVVLYMGEAVPTDQVQVPSVIGLTAEQARQKLADAGLYMRASGAAEYGSGVTAYEQSTAAGASVNRGTTIEVRFTDSTASGAGL